MKFFLSHCGLVDARIRASNKDLPVQDDEPEVFDDESSAETAEIYSENEDTNGLGEDSETESNIVIVPTVYKNDSVKPGPKSKLKPKPKEIWWCSPKKGTKTLFFLFSI